MVFWKEGSLERMGKCPLEVSSPPGRGGMGARLDSIIQQTPAEVLLEILVAAR